MTLNSAKENGPTWRKSLRKREATRVTCASLIGLLSLAHARQMYTEKKSDIELSCICAAPVSRTPSKRTRFAPGGVGTVTFTFSISGGVISITPYTIEYSGRNK
jgi:hypothetical protein